VLAILGLAALFGSLAGDATSQQGPTDVKTDINFDDCKTK
jgi:hypothetical protein